MSSANKLKTLFASNRAQVPMAAKKNFFVDDDGALHRRRSNGDHQLILPETLVHEVTRQNHEPVYVAHPGT